MGRSYWGAQLGRGRPALFFYFEYSTSRLTWAAPGGPLLERLLAVRSLAGRRRGGGRRLQLAHGRVGWRAADGRLGARRLELDEDAA
eukprot:3024496-Prymnesium_polylepis.1